MAHPLESSTLAVYSELSSLLAQQEAVRSFALLRGSFVEKTVRGRPYLYFQFVDPVGRQRQVYIGASDSAVAQEMRATYEAGRGDPSAHSTLPAIERLARQLHAAGLPTIDPLQFKVIARLADFGLFRAGSLLIGTHAFNALAPSLGVTWNQFGRTSDVDFATSETIAMVAPERPKLDVRSELDALKMGFFPIPSLSLTKPSTSFKAGRTSLQIDFLTPETSGSGHRVLEMQGLGIYAESLLYLDYLLEGIARLPVIGQSNAVLANIPDPGRFAVHKLITADCRGPGFRDKALKDLAQAREMLDVLLELHPGILRDALDALLDYRQAYIKHFKGGLSRLKKQRPDLVHDVLSQVEALSAARQNAAPTGLQGSPAKP